MTIINNFVNIANTSGSFNNGGNGSQNFSNATVNGHWNENFSSAMGPTAAAHAGNRNNPDAAHSGHLPIGNQTLLHKRLPVANGAIAPHSGNHNQNLSVRPQPKLLMPHNQNLSGQPMLVIPHNHQNLPCDARVESYMNRNALSCRTSLNFKSEP